MSYPRIDIKEVDKSQPTNQASFSGTPAAVIGTSKSGPAFVPTLVNSEDMFKGIFGSIDSKHWGSVAVRQWYDEAKANAGLVYTRVLGVGDGNKRGTNNVVTNAGFVVGEQQVQTQDAYDAAKAYNTHGNVSVGSKGYNPFASQTTTVHAGNFASCVIADPSSAAAHSQTIIITVGGSTVLTITTDTGVTYSATPTLSGATHTLGVDSTPSDTQVYTSLAYLLDQLDNVSATSSGGTSVTITADTKATTTYDIVVTGTYIAGGHASSTSTSGTAPLDSSASPGRVYFVATIMSESAGSTYLTDAGLSGAVQPILRACILVASGVNLTLSGWNYSDSGEAALTGSKYAWDKYSVGRFNAGSPIGAMKNPTTTQEVKFIFNGMLENSGEVKRVVTVGLNPGNPGYLGGLNTDPDMLEQTGHYLYAHYPVPTELAIPTAVSSSAANSWTGVHQFTQKKVSVDTSGVVTQIGSAESYYHNVLITTGSYTRNDYGGSGYKPNYEGWNDRFSTPFTPWVLSQTVGGSEKKLFRIHSLDDGQGAEDSYFAEIYDIEYPEMNLKILFEKTKLIDDVKRDIKGIYNLHLDAIGKYKIDDLKKIAIECNIDLKNNGKGKNKSILYDEINMYKLDH